MIRAIFFDFYSVWTPDKFGYYLALAEQSSPEIAKDLSDVVEQYYHGKVDLDFVASNFKFKLLDAKIDAEEFKVREADISPDIITFMRNLHSHFVKIGILANLGLQELDLLDTFNKHYQVFEVIASPLSLDTPAPLLSSDVYIKAMQQIGEPPQSCLLISGNLPYLEFAASLGLTTLQFEGLSKLQASLNQILSSEIPGSA
jgi:FMN phosphatase YigB (HAD superfamily)